MLSKYAQVQMSMVYYIIHDSVSVNFGYGTEIRARILVVFIPLSNYNQLAKGFPVRGRERLCVGEERGCVGSVMSRQRKVGSSRR
ncbi:hypothetical protein TNCV_1569721 [Trichonephila clavipes]|uniref:Uncharacterized protein n=1 Tax=Trichonephila clavipes TaxID=2585209 RepID=A0A8X6VP34_TRICX|nr:hypothetical protein TNCV_1569721 [Trichonephila clavipes]